MTSLLVIAHRGASAYAPEHSFAAWDLALAQGADYLEQDLQLTRDGVLIVLHDETLDRTVRAAGRRCHGLVSDRTLAELQECEVGSWFNEARPERARAHYSGERVPTLEAVLERYADRACLYVETKQPETAPGMEEALVALLRKYGLVEPASRAWRVLVQSFSEASLRRVRGLEPGLPLIQLVDEEEAAAETMRRLERIAEYAVGIGPHFSRVDATLVARAHRHCLAVHPYTVNDAAAQSRMMEAGVDGMFTDYPDRLLAGRPASEPRGPNSAVAAAAARARCVAGQRKQLPGQ